MNIQDDHFDLLLARVVFHRDMLTEDLKRMERDRYVVTALSKPESPFGDEEWFAVKQYEMSLSQLTRWLQESCSRDPPEQIARITPLGSQ